MSTPNVCFHGEIRKLSVLFGTKKKKKTPFLELYLDRRADGQTDKDVTIYAHPTVNIIG